MKKEKRDWSNWGDYDWTMFIPILLFAIGILLVIIGIGFCIGYVAGSFINK